MQRKIKYPSNKMIIQYDKTKIQQVNKADKSEKLKEDKEKRRTTRPKK